MDSYRVMITDPVGNMTPFYIVVHAYMSIDRPARLAGAILGSRSVFELVVLADWLSLSKSEGYESGLLYLL